MQYEILKGNEKIAGKSATFVYENACLGPVQSRRQILVKTLVIDGKSIFWLGKNSFLPACVVLMYVQ